MKTKKRSSSVIAEFLSPKASEDQKSPKIIQRSDADHSQIIGEDADANHSQIIGGDAVKLLGEIYPPISPGFGTPDYNVIDWSNYQLEKNIAISKHDFCGNSY